MQDYTTRTHDRLPAPTSTTSSGRRRSAVGVALAAIVCGFAPGWLAGCTDEAPASAEEKASIRETFRTNTEELRACYDGMLEEDASLRGELVLQFTIAPDGSVVAPTVQRSTMDSPALDACLLSVVSGWTFPERSEPAVVSYPLILRPSDERRAGGGDQLQTGGHLSADVVRETVRSANPGYLRCYEERLAVRPELEGRLVVGFTVTEEGEVRELGSVEDSLGDDALAECVLERVGSLRFPSPEGGPVRVRYPLNFSR